MYCGWKISWSRLLLNNLLDRGWGREEERFGGTENIFFLGGGECFKFQWESLFPPCALTHTDPLGFTENFASLSLPFCLSLYLLTHIHTQTKIFLWHIFFSYPLPFPAYYIINQRIKKIDRERERWGVSPCLLVRGYTSQSGFYLPPRAWQCWRGRLLSV